MKNNEKVAPIDKFDKGCYQFVSLQAWSELRECCKIITS